MINLGEKEKRREEKRERKNKRMNLDSQIRREI